MAEKDALVKAAQNVQKALNAGKKTKEELEKQKGG